MDKQAVPEPVVLPDVATEPHPTPHADEPQTKPGQGSEEGESCDPPLTVSEPRGS